MGQTELHVHASYLREKYIYSNIWYFIIIIIIIIIIIGIQPLGRSGQRPELSRATASWASSLV